MSCWPVGPCPGSCAAPCCTSHWSCGSTWWCQRRRCCSARASAFRKDACPGLASSSPPCGADLVETALRAGERVRSLVAALPFAFATLEQVVAMAAVAEPDQLARGALRQVGVVVDRQEVADRRRRSGPQLAERRLADVAH